MNYIHKLYSERRELVLLQWTYLIMSILAVVIAGLIALIDRSSGVSILIVPLVAITTMSMNVVAWALVKLAVETVLPKQNLKKNKMSTKASKKKVTKK